MQVDAAITKAELKQCVERYGATNTKQYREAAPGALVYVTFAGARDVSTGLYTGVHQFRPAASADDGVPLFDFNKLPGVPKCQ